MIYDGLFEEWGTHGHPWPQWIINIFSIDMAIYWRYTIYHIYIWFMNLIHWKSKPYLPLPENRRYLRKCNFKKIKSWSTLKVSKSPLNCQISHDVRQRADLWLCWEPNCLSWSPLQSISQSSELTLQFDSERTAAVIHWFINQSNPMYTVHMHNNLQIHIHIHIHMHIHKILIYVNIHMSIYICQSNSIYIGQYTYVNIYIRQYT